jgi:hypothetical protein
MWILEHRKLLSEGQNGFRKGRSTSDIVLILERVTSKGYANGRHTLVVFYVKKAYDRVVQKNSA